MIYEYKCEACGHEFEVEQKISDQTLNTCTSCQEPKAKRQISKSSFILRGGGWYRDGYSGKNR